MWGVEGIQHAEEALFPQYSATTGSEIDPKYKIKTRSNLEKIVTDKKGTGTRSV